MDRSPVSFSRRALSYLICALLVGQPVAPAFAAALTPVGQTTTDQAGNGVPVVNIATPNGAGVSHNPFKDYNVGSEGLILNNASGRLNQTQLGGIIQNNPHLQAGKEARAIINEVTGGSRSQLQGYTEVAGKAANVMVANPYGITCNGCGFINTPQATLTTGKPVFDANGNLQALEVRKGTITIEGKGIDASGSDALSLISRATEINARIHAKNLNIIAGANRVNADGSVQALQGEGCAPAVAVDTGALGGMYANRIHLVSSEKGLGVNLGNLNARQGDIQLDASGKLTVNNSLASGSLTARGDGVTLTGSHKSGGAMSVTSSQALALNNAQLASSKADVTLQSGGALSAQGSTLSAGNNLTLKAQQIALDGGSRADATGDVHLQASEMTSQAQVSVGRNFSLNADRATNGGQLVAKGRMDLNAGSLSNSGTLQGNDVVVKAETLSNRGSLQSGGALNVNVNRLTQQGSLSAKGDAAIAARDGLHNSGSITADGELDVTADDLTQDGTLSGSAGLKVTAGQLASRQGALTTSQGDIAITAARDVSLDGSVEAQGVLAVSGKHLSTGSSAQLQSGKEMTLAADSANLNGTHAAKDSISVAAQTLNHGGKSNAQRITLTAPQTLNNRGTLVADSLTLTGQQITNSGLLKGVNALNLHADALDNLAGGTLYSAASLALEIPELTNNGLITTDGDLTLKGNQLVNSGEINGVNLRSEYATLRGDSDSRMLADEALSIQAQRVENGGLLAGDTLGLTSDSLRNQGVMQGAKALTLTAGESVNDGKWRSDGALTLTGGQLINSGDLSAASMQLELTHGLDNHASGRLLADEALDLTTPALVNHGQVAAATLSINGDSTTNDGTLLAKVLALHGDLQTSGILQGSQSLTWNGDTFSNLAGGQITGGDTLRLTGKTLNNQGQMESREIALAADRIDNGGRVQAQDNLQVSAAGNITNQGALLSQNAIGLTAAQLANDGSIAAKDLTLNTPQLTNNGLVQGNGGLQLTTRDVFNGQQGQLVSGSGLALNLDRLENHGRIQSQDGFTLSGKQLINAGEIHAGALDLTLQDSLTNQGNLLAERAIAVTTDSLDNRGVLVGQNLTLGAKTLNNRGLIQADDSILATADTTTTDAAGKWLSGNALTVNGDTLSNAGVMQGGTLGVTANALTNDGVLNGLNGVNATLGGQLDNRGHIQSGGAVTIAAARILNPGRMAGDTLDLHAGTLSNDGLWQGTNGLTLKGAALTTGAVSRTLSGGVLMLDAGQLNTQGTLQGQQVSVTADDWTHSGSLVSAGALTANVGGTLTSPGALMSHGALSLTAGTLDNAGQILSESDITLDGLQLNNRGSAQGNTLAVHQGRINNQGTLIGLQSLTLEGRPRLLARMAMAAAQQTLINGASGSLMSQGTLTIASGAVTNAGTWQGQSILLNAQSLANSGTLQSGDALQITLADNLTTAAGSKITALGTAALQALALTNQGEWAAKNLTLKGTTLTNDGTISGVDGLSVTASTLTNNRDGKVVSGQGLNVTAASLFNDGLIQGGGETRISAATQARNDGKLFSGAQMTLTTPQYAGAGWLQATDLTLNAATASNSGTWLADKATLTGDVFTNQGMTQAGNLTTNYRQLTNNGTLLGNARLEVRGGNVTHNNGKLFSGGDLSVDSATLDGAGQVVALGNLALNLTNAFTAQGVLAANKQLAIRSQGEMTNQGTIQGNGITLEAGGRFINNGQLKAGNGTSALSGSDVALNGSGLLQSGGDVSIASRSNITLNGFTGTAGSLLLSAPGAIVNTALLYAGNNLSLFANSIHNQRGDILAGNNLVMQKDANGAANSEVINTSGTIETQNGDIAINTGYLRNTWDQISATETTTDLTASRPWLQGGAKVLVPLSELKFGVDYGYYTTRDCSGGGSPGHGAGPSCHTTIHTAALKNAPELEFALQTITVGVNAQGRASRLSSGRHLTVNAGTLSNEASAILANGNISLTGRQLDNHSWTAGTTTVYQRYASTASLSGKYAQYGSADESKLSDSGVFNRKPISYTPTGTRRTDTAGETLYRAVIQAGGAVMANFASNISNTNTASNSGRVSNTVSAPALNTLSHQTIDGGAQKQNLAGGDVASLPWKDQLQGALQQLNGGSGLDTGGVSDAALTTISTSQKGNANLGQVDGLKNAGLIDASLRGAKGDAMGQYQGKTVDTSAYPLPTGDNGYFVFSDNPKSPYLININPKLNGLGQLDSALFGELNALLGITPGTTAPVETRSVWTNEKQFIGSSYMLGRLNLNTEKDYRFLGDAAFDTRYVSNKVLNQTGSRYLNGLGSDLDQMRYLMDNAAASQKSMNLAFGVSLSADQIASLDRSMLWWESATINGEMVMVPKLYLSPKDVALNNGSVIAGNNVTLKGGAIANDNSTLLASNNLTLDSQDAIGNLNNSLMQAGGDLNLSALGDINNISATISGKTVQLESLDGSINNLTRADQWAFTANGHRGDGSVNLYGTDIGQTASIAATGGMSLKAGDNINITGAQVRAGGDLALAAGGDVMVGANQINQGLSQTNFWSAKDRSVSSTTHQGSNLAAGGNLTVQAGNDLNITASHVDAGKSAQLAAGNDINLNAGETHQNSRYANSESHASGADVSMLTAGDNLTLTARRDISSQAAGIAAEGNVGLQAGRDVNLLAEATASGDSSRSGKKTVINETVRQKGTDIASGGDTVVIAGRDVNTQAAQVQATGDIGIAAGRDLNLSTATESDYSYKETLKTKKGFLSKTTTHKIQEESATHEKGTLLSGDNVTLQAGSNLLVKGSAVAADGDVTLNAGDNVTVEAATNQASHYSMTSTRKSGVFGGGSLGITIGSQSTKSERKGAEVTQSDSRSVIGTTGGNVIINAGKQATLSAADVVAARAADDNAWKTGHIDITASDIAIIPGRDVIREDRKQSSKSSGLTLSIADPIINGIRNIRDIAHSGADGITKAKQLSNEIAATGADMGMGTSLPLTYGRSSSDSESHYQGVFNSGSAVNASGNVQLTATGKSGHGDILINGSSVSAGEAVIMDAKRDVAISTSTDSESLSSKASSKGWSITTAMAGAGAASRALNGAPNNGADVLPFALDNSNSKTARSSTRENAALINGADIYINSHEGRVDIAGSSLAAINDLLVATEKGNINITTGNNADRQSQSGSHSMVGNLGGDGYSGVVGWRKDDFRSTSDSNQQSTIRSQIVSQKGNVSLQGGNDVQVQGADISAGKSLVVSGKNVLLDASKDRLQTHDESSSTQYGIKGAVSGWAVSAAQSAERAARSAQEGRDPRLTGIYTAQAGLNAATQTMQSNMNPSAFKVSVSATAGKSAQEQDYQRNQQQGSRLQAGESVAIKATDDIVGQGVDISGKNILLNAGRDIVLNAAQNSESLKNQASGSQVSAGVGFSLGGSQNGFTGEFGYSGNDSRESGNNQKNQNSKVHADETLTLISGRDTRLIGAELSGDKVVADIGRDLTIASVQDRAKYDSKSTSSGVNLSVCVPPFCFGNVVEGSANASAEKLNNNYQSVKDQSGIYAGSGGFDITVGQHTQLDGAVLASEASADKNRLDTGTLGWKNLDNLSEWSGKQAGATVTNTGMPTTALGQVTGDERGTTHSAVADGTIIIRDKDRQQQDIAGLSRDTANANHSVKDGFDAGKVKDKLEIQKEATALGIQAANAYKAAMEHEAAEKNAALKDEISREHPGATEEALNAAVKNDSRYIDAEKEYGPGSDFWRATSGATGLIAGILGGNIEGGVSAGVAPYMAKLVKDASGTNEVARVALHGIVSAALAQAQGGNALSAAAGGMMSAAVMGERLADAFFGKKVDELNGEERQFISNLATVVGAVAGGSVGGDSFSAASGANAARVEVENNALSDIAENQHSGMSQQEKYQKAQDDLKKVTEEFKAKNCAGLSADACGAKMDAHRDELLAGFADAGSDFIPVYGDIKSFKEADSALGYLAAVIGILPGLGDEAGALLKGADKALKGGDLEAASKLIARAGDDISSAKYFGQERKFWSAEPVEFSGNKVYQRNDLFDPQQVSSWKEKGQTVTGTNIDRMASGRAPIGTDGKSVNLHHMTQSQNGPIAEVTQSFHQENSSVIHINPNTTPSGINRPVFDKWKSQYWQQRAAGYGK